MREIGRVIGTERKPSTAYTFQFWAKPEENIGIGSIVKVSATVGDTEVTVYGVVVEAQGFNDLESPLHEYLSVGGNATAEPPTLRHEIRVFQAAVLRRDPEEPVGAVPLGQVCLAEEKDVQTALRTEKYAEEFGIVCGVYGPKDAQVPVHLHRDFLLGPESGHLNMTGTSGLAAKTSYILFLLKAIFEHYESGKPGEQSGVAALLFNTKGGDLLYIDREPKETLPDEHLALYKRCGIDPTPFKKVVYFAPYDARNWTTLNSIRQHPELERENPTWPFAFGLQDIIDHFEVLVGRDDLDAKASGYLGYLRDEYVLGTGRAIEQGEAPRTAKTLGELTKIIRAELRRADESSGTGKFGVHHPLTMRKVLNRLESLEHRYSGLISRDGVTEGPLVRPLEPGTIYVVDVNELDSDAKDLVFASFVSQLKDKMEQRQLGVDKLIVMVDEMNKYAPTGGGDNHVSRALREISARGRYMGLTLFGAQQFRSRVDKEIVGNAATHAFGHIEAEELAQPGYSYFTPAVKEKLATLPTGDVLIKHPHFAQPIFVRFPLPPCMKGSDGMRDFPAQRGITAKEALTKQALSMGGNTSPNRIADAIESLGDGEHDLTRLLTELRRAAPGTDPVSILETGKKKAFRAEPRPTLSEADPFERE